MHKNIAIITKVALCAILALGFVSSAKAEDTKAGPAGTWSWTVPSRNGGAERKMTLKLKVEGDKLTGKLTMPGRQGATTETEITEGKVKGDEVSFTVVREFNGNKFTSKYNGKLTGDTIKGKIEFERDGNTNTRDWEAKREADKT